VQYFNAHLIGYTGLYQVQIEGGAVTAILPQADWLSTGPGLSLAGDWLSLGGVDLQINGALGLAFPELTLDDLPRLQQICELLWAEGIDAFLPTLVTTATANIHRALAVIKTFLQQPQASNQAKIWGVHLEGPFLNPEKRGAHPQAFLQPLTLDTLQQVLGDYADLVTMITLAPELDSTGQAITYLQALGIHVSLGHSQTTAEQASQAFASGAHLVTHAFNAMPSLHHRQPGLLGAALFEPGVACGLIADGQHVSPLMLHLLLQRPDVLDKLFLVSDALAPLGLADGLYPWDEREIVVCQGTARLQDGTLSGTTLSLLRGVQNLWDWQLCSPEIAIALATDSPRRALQRPGLEVGSPATLLRWHWQENPRRLVWQRLEP
jgi:N-acetylglucosamine-6-phosphate deacetylase